MALSESEKQRRKEAYAVKKAAGLLPRNPLQNYPPIISDEFTKDIEAAVSKDMPSATLKDTIAESGMGPSRTALTIDKVGGYWHCIEYTIVDDQVTSVDYGEQLLRADAFNQFKSRAARKLFGIVPTKAGDV